MTVDQWLHELVGVLVLLRVSVVARLYARHHVSHLAPLSVYQQVISHLDAFPAVVTVHGVITAYD